MGRGVCFVVVVVYREKESGREGGRKEGGQRKGGRRETGLLPESQMHFIQGWLLSINFSSINRFCP